MRNLPHVRLTNFDVVVLIGMAIVYNAKPLWGQ